MVCCCHMLYIAQMYKIYFMLFQTLIMCCFCFATQCVINNNRIVQHLTLLKHKENFQNKYAQHSFRFYNCTEYVYIYIRNTHCHTLLIKFNTLQCTTYLLCGLSLNFCTNYMLVLLIFLNMNLKSIYQIFRLVK